MTAVQAVPSLAATVTATAVSRWTPLLAFWTWNATVWVGPPGVSGPPVAASVVTTNAELVPVLAAPVPVPSEDQ